MESKPILEEESWAGTNKAANGILILTDSEIKLQSKETLPQIYMNYMVALASLSRNKTIKG